MRVSGVILVIFVLLAPATAAVAQPTGASVNIGELPFGQVFFTVGATGAATLVDLT